MFIKPGDFLKIRPRDRDLWDKIVVPMFMVEQFVGDAATIKLLHDCVIVSTDGHMWPLTQFEIIYVNGRDIFTYDPEYNDDIQLPPLLN